MNPIFLKFGSITIYWYSIFILTALVIGFLITKKEAKKHNISADVITDLLFFLVPIAIIGARIYYVIFNLDYYVLNPIEIFYIWNGGLAIHGAIIAGLLYLIYFVKKKNYNLLLFTDMIAICLFLGQALGRWGNFMNSEAYGSVVSLETLQHYLIPNFIIQGMNIDGVYHFPTFYFESIGCILGFITLFLLKRKKDLKIGKLTSVYFIWYGILRFFIESSRTDSLMLGSLKMAQIISIIMVVLGVGIWIYSNKLNKLYHKEVY